jgi:chorismate mutase
VAWRRPIILTIVYDRVGHLDHQEAHIVSSDPAQDALIRQMRDQIVENDLRIVGAINTRLTLVARLRAYKAANDITFVDPSREQWMHGFLQSANPGPLSAEGLQAIYDELLDLTKRETATAPEQSPQG